MNIFHLNNRNSQKPKIFNATTSYSIMLPFSSRSNSSSRLKSLPAHSPFSLSRSNSSPAHSNLTNFDHVVIRNSFSSRSGWHLMRSQCDPSWPWRWSYHRKLGCSRRIIVWDLFSKDWIFEQRQELLSLSIWMAFAMWSIL